MSFKAMKFKIESEEHFRHIQEVLFDLGYSWITHGQSFNPTMHKYPCVTTDDDGYIYVGDMETAKPLMTIEPVSKFEIKPVKQMTHEEVEEALGHKVEITN